MMGIVVPKHVEQAIRYAIKTSVASSWHFISTYIDRHTSVALTLPEVCGQDDVNKYLKLK